MDPRTNTVAWQKNGDWSLAHGNGIQTTAGRVMFQGRPDGALVAMDDTVTLGRIWNSSTSAPGTTENTVSQNAMAPQHLVVPVGTTVTFVNPTGNASAHGATSFFEYEFDAGVLVPGQSYTHTFAKAGEYFYNDPIFPQSTGKIVVP
jgi:plastocyanin